MSAKLLLERPIAALRGDRFIIRDHSASQTIGGGIVADPCAQRRVRNTVQRSAQLRALEHNDPIQSLSALLECTPKGIDLAWFGLIFNLTSERMRELVRRSDVVVVGREPGTAFSLATFDSIRTGMLETLQRLRAGSPHGCGVAANALRRAWLPDLPTATFEALLRRLTDEKLISANGSWVCATGSDPEGGSVESETWDHVKSLLEAAGFNGLTLTDLVHVPAIHAAEVNDLLFRKMRAGLIMRVEGQRFFLKSTIARFAALVYSASLKCLDGRFGVAQIRDHIGIGRSRTTEILELLDRMGVTRRFGDQRILQRNRLSVLDPIRTSAPANDRVSQ